MTSDPSSAVTIPRWLPAIIFASIAVIYLSTLTSDYYWDGITFALQIEKVAKAEARLGLLFHQNHLLYNALGYLAYRSFGAVGFGVRALDLLQTANALIGAAAVVVFFRIAVRVTRSVYVAMVCAGFLAFSAAWWKISTDNNAYIASILLILVCAGNLFGAKPRWYVAGAALAGAMLVHQLASLFYPAALAAVFLSRTIQHRARFAAWLSAAAWVPVIAAYYVSVYFLVGLSSPFAVVKWAVSNPSLQPVAADPLGALLLLPKTNFDAIFGHNLALFREQGGWVEMTMALAAVVVAILSVVTAIRKVNATRAVRTLRQTASELSAVRKQVAVVVALWLGSYVLFLLLWGPLIYFRAFYTPALCLVLGLILSNYHGVTGSKPSGAAALAVMAFAFLNLAFYIGPNMRANANAKVAAARNAAKAWDERTVIYFGNQNEADTAFEYFNPSTTWRRLSRASLAELDGEIARIYNQGGSVWLNRGAVSRVNSEWLARHSTNQRIEIDLPNDSVLYVRVSP